MEPFEAKNLGRVLGSQIYVGTDVDTVSPEIPFAVRDIFINSDTGDLFQFDGDVWVKLYTLSGYGDNAVRQVLTDEEALEFDVGTTVVVAPEDGVARVVRVTQNELAEKQLTNIGLGDGALPFVTAAVNNLVNYYKKSEVYNKGEIDALIGAIHTIEFQVVERLPQVGQSNVIYLVPHVHGQSDLYDEYCWIASESKYEKIGNTDALANYYNKDEVDAFLALKANEADVYPKSQTYTKDEADALLAPKAATQYVDEQLALKADKSDTYTKAQDDAFLANKADKATTYTKTENDALLDAKADKSNTYTKTEVDSALATKQDTLTFDDEPTQGSSNPVKSGGVHSAIATASAALDSKISKNAEDIATLTEAITKKDLYETQEATFQGMTAVPAGAMAKAYLDGFKGNSAVVNQLVQNGNFASASGWTAFDGTLSVSNNTARISFSENAPASARLQRGGFSFVAGHTYLITAVVSSSISNTAALGYFITSSIVLSDESIGTSKKTLFSLFTPSASGTGNIRLFVNRGGTGATGDYVDVENFMLIDLSIVPLTSAEMASVSTAKAALKYKDMDVDFYIPFNAGTLTDSRLTKLISNPYNLFDEIMELGRFDLTTGGNVVTTNTIRTKNPIPVVAGQTYRFEIINNLGNTFLFMLDENGTVIPPSQWTTSINIGDINNAKVITNTTYKSNTFVVPPNGAFVKFYCTDYGTTYRNDICVHLNSANLGYKPHIKPAARVILPPEYQQVEYIQSSGTQYIDTGLVGDAGYEIRAELNFTALSTGNYQYFGGFAYTGSTNRVYYIRLNNSSNSLGYTYGSVNTDTTNLALLTADQWYDIDSLMNDKDQRLWLNGKLIGSTAYSLTGVDPTNPVNIYLFCSQYVSSATSYCQVKARRVRIFKDGNLVRDFVPCYKKANNEVGMFDLVSGSFFGNAGTGTFSKGDDCMETVYYLDMPTLKSVGSVQDESKAGGEKVGKVNLGDYTPSIADASTGQFRYDSVTNSPSVTYYDVPNFLCSKYPVVSGATMASSSVDKVIGRGNQYQDPIVKDSAMANKTPSEIQTDMAGVMLNFEKSTPTDFSSAISYPEIINVEAGGSLEPVGDGCDATTKVYFYVEA